MNLCGPDDSTARRKGALRSQAVAVQPVAVRLGLVVSANAIGSLLFFRLLHRQKSINKFASALAELATKAERNRPLFKLCLGGINLGLSENAKFSAATFLSHKRITGSSPN